MNISEASARLALRRYPLDCISIKPDYSGRIYLIIEGWTSFAKALFWQTVKVAHFHLKPTGIIIINSEFENIKAEIFNQSPGLDDKWCRDILINIEFAKNFDLNAFKLKSEDIVTVAVFNDNADRSFIRGLTYRQSAIKGLKQIYIELPDDSGYREAVGKLKSDIPLFSVGASAEAFELAETLDDNAKSLHARYLKQREMQNRRKKLQNGEYESKSDYDWEYLDEIRRGWNRASADHIEIKLRALADFYGLINNRPIYDPLIAASDYSAVKNYINEIVKSGTKAFRNDLEFLAKIEHDRWCAEKIAEGWSFAEVKDENKKHTPIFDTV